MVDYQSGGELRCKYHFVGAEGGKVTEKGQTWENFNYQGEGCRPGRRSL